MPHLDTELVRERWLQSCKLVQSEGSVCGVAQILQLLANVNTDIITFAAGVDKQERGPVRNVVSIYFDSRRAALAVYRHLEAVVAGLERYLTIARKQVVMVDELLKADNQTARDKCATRFDEIVVCANSEVTRKLAPQDWEQACRALEGHLSKLMKVLRLEGGSESVFRRNFLGLVAAGAMLTSWLVSSTRLSSSFPPSAGLMSIMLESISFVIQELSLRKLPKYLAHGSSDKLNTAFASVCALIKSEQKDAQAFFFRETSLVEAAAKDAARCLAVYVLSTQDKSLKELQNVHCVQKSTNALRDAAEGLGASIATLRHALELYEQCMTKSVSALDEIEDSPLGRSSSLGRALCCL